MSKTQCIIYAVYNLADPNHYRVYATYKDLDQDLSAIHDRTGWWREEAKRFPDVFNGRDGTFYVLLEVTGYISSQERTRRVRAWQAAASSVAQAIEASGSEGRIPPPPPPSSTSSPSASAVELAKVVSDLNDDDIVEFASGVNESTRSRLRAALDDDDADLPF